MKFPTIALSAIGASLAMLASAPAFAAAHTGKPMDSATAASAAVKDKATSGKTRAEVKKARDAAPHIPAGENVTGVPGQVQTKGKMSDTTRAEVKATRDAAPHVPAGENVTNVPGQVQTNANMSDKTRMEVKDKTKQAKTDGTAVPAGEASSKAQQKGVKQ